MTDDIVKQLVLRLKVENEGEVDKISKNLAKNTEMSAKAFPVREMTDLMRMSEKVGGEFKKVVDELKTLRLTNLKTEVKDINGLIETMLGNLKRARQQGNTRAEAYLTGQISNLAQRGESAGYEAAGMQRPSMMQRMGGASGVGLAAGAFATQAYGAYGQYQRTTAEQQGMDINARLNSIQQLMQPIKREQDLYYGGNLTRLSLERGAGDRARETARAQIQMERQALEGRVKESTGAIGRRAVQGAATIGIGGAFMGGPLGGMVGAGLGAMGGATEGFFEQYRARKALSRYSENQQGRYAELYNQNRQNISQDPQEVLLQQFENQAIPMNRMRQAYGGDMSQLQGQGIDSGNAYSEQEIRGMMPGISSKTGGFRGSMIARGTSRLQTQGYQGAAGTLNRLQTAISRQGGSAGNIAGTFKRTQTATEGEPAFQEGLNQNLSGILENSRVRLDPGKTAGRMGYVAGQVAPGQDPQMALSAFQQVMGIPDFMKSSGTMENQLYRSNIRSLIFKSGKTGGEAASLENMLSSMDVNELQSPQVQGMLKGMGINPQEALSARVHSTEQRLNTILPKDMVQKLKRGGFKTKDEAHKFFQRAAMIETGGTIANPEALEMEARKLQTELTPNLRARSTGPMGNRSMGAMDKTVGGLAGSKNTALSQGIREGDTLAGAQGPEGDKFRNKIGAMTTAGMEAPVPGGGAFGTEIDDVKSALDAFVSAVNGATGELGGVQAGQKTVQSGSANTKGSH